MTDDYDVATSVIQTLDGGFIMYGMNTDDSFLYSDVVVKKLSCSGSIEWERTIGVSFVVTQADVSRTIRQNLDSTYIISGTTTDTSGTHSEAFLMKLSSSGTTIWTRHYGGSGAEDGHDVRITSDGGYILCGWSDSNSAGGSDAYLIKVDDIGNVEWEYRYGGANADHAYKIALADDGGYVLGGFTHSFGLGGPGDMYMLKVDSLGAFEWQKTFGTLGDDQGNSLIKTLDGGYAFVGQVTNGSNYDAYFVKTDSNGNIEWDSNYGSPSNFDNFYDVVQLEDSSYVMVGSHYLNPTQAIDMYMMKINSVGDSLWSVGWGNTSTEEYAYDINKTSDNGFIIAGQYSNIGPPLYDLWVIKTDSLGCDSPTCSLDCIACDFILPAGYSNADTLWIFDNGTVQFSDSSAVVNDWNWNFGDGAFSTEQHPFHLYDSGGVYNVALYASYGSCTDTAWVNVVVIDTLDCDTILANFTLTDTLWISDADSVNLSGPPNVNSWSWDFGSLGTSTNQNPTITFTAGSYIVSLVVEVDTLCWDSVAQSIVVIDTVTGLASLESQVSGFKLYPNPNTGTFTIEFSYKVADNVSFHMYDRLGRKVKTISLTGKGNAVTISEENLYNGLYIYELRIDGEIKVSDKVIVHK